MFTTCIIDDSRSVIDNYRSIMEQHDLSNVNDCLNTNIYFYLETSGGQSSNPYLNVVNFLNTRAD
jgi:hypothetical protein